MDGSENSQRKKMTTFKEWIEYQSKRNVHGRLEEAFGDKNHIFDFFYMADEKDERVKEFLSELKELMHYCFGRMGSHQKGIETTEKDKKIQHYAVREK